MLVYATNCDNHGVLHVEHLVPAPHFLPSLLIVWTGLFRPGAVWRGVQFDPSAFVASTRSLVPLERLRDDLQEHLRDRKQVHGRRRFFFCPSFGVLLAHTLLRFVSSLPFRQKLRLQQTCVRLFFSSFFF